DEEDVRRHDAVDAEDDEDDGDLRPADLRARRVLEHRLLRGVDARDVLRGEAADRSLRIGDRAINTDAERREDERQHQPLERLRVADLELADDAQRNGSPGFTSPRAMISSRKPGR